MLQTNLDTLLFCSNLQHSNKFLNTDPDDDVPAAVTTLSQGRHFFGDFFTNVHCRLDALRGKQRRSYCTAGTDVMIF
jgi:hypothetical protein